MIYTLSIVGLFKVALYILAFYFIVKILARLFAPYLVKYVAKKAEQKFGQQFKGFQNRTQPNQKSQRAGETVIDKIPNNKTSNKDVGEYIDYEEVE